MCIDEQVRYYVVRKELKFKKGDNDSGFKDWEELERVIVDQSLLTKMKQQFPIETSFKEAAEQGIFMLNRHGDKVNKIRHIRCYAHHVKKPLKIKRHTYLSDKEYK